MTTCAVSLMMSPPLCPYFTNCRDWCADFLMHTESGFPAGVNRSQQTSFDRAPSLHRCHDDLLQEPVVCILSSIISILSIQFARELATDLKWSYPCFGILPCLVVGSECAPHEDDRYERPSSSPQSVSARLLHVVVLDTIGRMALHNAASPQFPTLRKTPSSLIFSEARISTRRTRAIARQPEACFDSLD
jgi:hypothetical protein